MEILKATIEEFKKSNLHDRFSSWALNIIAKDFYKPMSYNSGDIIGDENFNEEGMYNAYNQTLKDAYTLFTIEWALLPSNNNEHNRSVQDALKKNEKEILNSSLYPEVMWGAVFCYGMISSQKKNIGLLRHLMRPYFTDIVGNHMREIGNGHEQMWLDFYVMMNEPINVSLLPKPLQSDEAMSYWDKLKHKNIINDKFQPSWTMGLKNYHIAGIVSNFLMKIGGACTWEMLENYFYSKGGKHYTNLRKEQGTYNNHLSKRDNSLCDAIEECFS